MDGTDQRSLALHQSSMGMSPFRFEPQQQNGRNASERGVGFFEVLWQRRILVASVIVLSLLLACVYLFVTPKSYQSTARLIIEQTGPGWLAESQGAVGSSTDTYLNAQCERILSAPVLKDVVSSLNQAGIKPPQGEWNIDDLRDSLTADVGRMNNIISIGSKSTNPNVAAKVANAVADAYIARYTAGRESSVFGVSKILVVEREKREAQRKQQLEALLKFKQDNGDVALQDVNADVVAQKLVAISNALTTAELATIDARITAGTLTKWAANVSLDHTPFPSGLVLDHDTQLLVDQLNNARIRLMAAGAGSMDHPASKSEAQSITTLGKAIAVASSQAFERTQAKESELRAMFNTQRDQALGLRSTDKIRLESELARSEKMIDQIDSRIHDLSIAGQAGSLDISVLEPAEPIFKASEPRQGRTLGIAALIGIFASFGLAMVRDKTDQRLNTANDLLNTITLPILGVVPRMPHSRGAKPSMVTLTRPMSLAAEAYRTIRTALFLSMPNETSKTILVTSPSPGEGKSTAASNLAIALAQAGYSTVLVEADLRKPVLDGVYTSKGAGTLNQLLRNEINVSQAVRKTPVPNLEVLVCNGAQHGAAEVIAGAGFKALVKELKENYQYVVLDSSPVCSVSDARVLAAMCDVTLVVVRARQSSRRLAVRAVEELVSAGANVLGLIVNDVKHSARRQFTEYGSYYYATPSSIQVQSALPMPLLQ